MRLSYPYALCLTILILEQNPFHPRFELFKNFLHFPFISYHFFFRMLTTSCQKQIDFCYDE